jgi:hypothetical protein
MRKLFESYRIKRNDGIITIDKAPGAQYNFNIALPVGSRDGMSGVLPAPCHRHR